MRPTWLWILAFSGLVAWFVADLDYARRWSLRRARLGAENKWRELNAHFEAALRCWRPLLLLFQRYVIPGLLEADYALHLSNQGENEKALKLAVKASTKAATRPAVLLQVLPAEAMILHRLGRYEEARTVIARGRRLLNDKTPPSELDEALEPPNKSNSLDNVEGILELSLGNLDAALAIADRSIHNGSATDPSRALASGVLTAKGRFQDALKVMFYEPANISHFFKPDQLEEVTVDDIGYDTIASMNEELASVFSPARHLGVALVHLEAGDVTNLGLALEWTSRELRSHQIMEHIFCRTRACWHAMKGGHNGVEADLTRARQLASEVPSRSAKYETCLATGRARFLLGQSDAAVDELKRAVELALHPMERHTSTYWLGRAQESAGRASEAAKTFASVIADNFGTWMAADAKRRSAN